jgi:hypothetical protein
VPAFPEPSDTVDTTVASLYAPARRGVRLTIRRLEILRTDLEPWQEISFADLRSGRFAPSDAHDYAIVANFTCIAEADLKEYTNEKIGAYLLPGNRLAAFDHYEFLEACVVHNDFVPARGELVRALEAAKAEER